MHFQTSNDQQSAKRDKQTIRCGKNMFYSDADQMAHRGFSPGIGQS